MSIQRYRHRGVVGTAAAAAAAAYEYYSRNPDTGAAHARSAREAFGTFANATSTAWRRVRRRHQITRRRTGAHQPMNRGGGAASANGTTRFVSRRGSRRPARRGYGTRRFKTRRRVVLGVQRQR